MPLPTAPCRIEEEAHTRLDMIKQKTSAELRSIELNAGGVRCVSMHRRIHHPERTSMWPDEVATRGTKGAMDFKTSKTPLLS